jgi:putative glutamine amidotransferase
MPGGDSREIMIKPLIGLSTYGEQARWGAWDVPAMLLPQAYADQVVEAGGIPLLLPPSGSAFEAAAAIAAIDGLVLTGGPDLDPARYGVAPDARTTGVQPGRDAWEADLLDAALAADLPVLGVCRGAQLLNIACGGTLRQDLPERVGHDGHRPAPGSYGAVQVDTDPAMLPGTVLGGSVQVQCSHHQAVEALGAGLVATAWHADGTIEAVCMPGRAFVVGVQWHPEAGTDPRLFQALVSAARPVTSDIRSGI